ncbi:MAG: 2-C-methyl-D-erythritol 4-phosphate cytidylyltransferase, partial [Selenomonas sp.]|nr:2-C-methyl-D-erythritol 4-phosphate cytidylyltransferase [Selenomonas sp.]
MVSAIFPAAGQGKRMNAGINKVLLELAGEPVLVRTLKTFSRVEAIAELIVVAAADEVAPVQEKLAGFAGLKPFKVVAGGSERQYSILNGLRQVSEAADVVLVHDAARP